MRFRICLTLLSLLTVTIPGIAQNPSAKEAKAKLDPLPFDEKADAKAIVRTALERAKKDNRRVLIHWGDNSSDWCVLLQKAFTTDAGLRRKKLYEYEMITVAVGPKSKNMELATQFKAAVSEGVPYLTILDGDGKVLTSSATAPFQAKNDAGQKQIDAKKLLDFLTKHEAKPLIAANVLQAGLDQAAKSDRQVFLHFGAPWCGWCHRLDDWMALPDVAKTLDKEFVDVRIDIDRMEGGKEIFERYNKSGNGGIPWFAFIDAKGKALVTSDGPKGNVGFPYEEHEIVHFAKMLETARRHLTQPDIERLGQSLKAQKKAGKS